MMDERTLYLTDEQRPSAHMLVTPHSQGEGSMTTTRRLRIPRCVLTRPPVRLIVTRSLTLKRREAFEEVLSLSYLLLPLYSVLTLYTARRLVFRKTKTNYHSFAFLTRFSPETRYS